jgi:very-short-patch-repair endonuclease
MDALINLKDCKEYMTITLGGLERQVKLSGTINDPFFCGKDVCQVLGHKNTNDAISRYVKSKNKKSLKEILQGVEISGNFTYNEGQMTYINIRGVEQLISKSKVCGPDQLQQIVDAFDVKIFITPRKEHLHLEAIEKTFSKVNMYKQFKVGRYRVDLYVEEYNLVVECDEYNHSDRNPKEEKERECFIKSELGCDFIRFNPDSKDFSIFSVLGDIHQHILNKIKN